MPNDDDDYDQCFFNLAGLCRKVSVGKDSEQTDRQTDLPSTLLNILYTSIAYCIIYLTISFFSIFFRARKAKSTIWNNNTKTPNSRKTSWLYIPDTGTYIPVPHTIHPHLVNINANVYVYVNVNHGWKTHASLSGSVHADCTPFRSLLSHPWQLPSRTCRKRKRHGHEQRSESGSHQCKYK